MGGCLFVFASLQISPLAGTWPANPPGRTTNVVLPKEPGSEGLNTKPKRRIELGHSFFSLWEIHKELKMFKAYWLESYYLRQMSCSYQFSINPSKDLNPF